MSTGCFANLEKLLLANRTDCIGVKTDTSHLRIDSTHKHTLTTLSSLQSFVEVGNIGREDGVTALSQFQLQCVVIQDVNELFLEVRDLSSFLNSIHQHKRINMLSRTIKQG